MTAQAIDVSERSETEHKVLENKCRRRLERRGLQLVKSRRRDPRAVGFGGYMISDLSTNTVVAGEIDSPRALSLDDVVQWLEK